MRTAFWSSTRANCANRARTRNFSPSAEFTTGFISCSTKNRKCIFLELLRRPDRFRLFLRRNRQATNFLLLYAANANLAFRRRSKRRHVRRESGLCAQEARRRRYIRDGRRTNACSRRGNDNRLLRSRGSRHYRDSEAFAATTPRHAQSCF